MTSCPDVRRAARHDDESLRGSKVAPDEAMTRDTKIGVEGKQPASEVAKLGFDAMMRGDGDVTSSFASGR